MHNYLRVIVDNEVRKVFVYDYVRGFGVESKICKKVTSPRTSEVGSLQKWRSNLRHNKRCDNLIRRMAAASRWDVESVKRMYVHFLAVLQGARVWDVSAKPNKLLHLLISP